MGFVIKTDNKTWDTFDSYNKSFIINTRTEYVIYRIIYIYLLLKKYFWYKKVVWYKT